MEDYTGFFVAHAMEVFVVVVVLPFALVARALALVLGLIPIPPLMEFLALLLLREVLFFFPLVAFNVRYAIVTSI